MFLTCEKEGFEKDPELGIASQESELAERGIWSRVKIVAVALSIATMSCAGVAISSPASHQGVHDAGNAEPSARLLLSPRQPAAVKALGPRLLQSTKPCTNWKPQSYDWVPGPDCDPTANPEPDTNGDPDVLYPYEDPTGETAWKWGSYMKSHPHSWVYGKYDEFRPPTWEFGRWSEFHPPDWKWGSTMKSHPPSWKSGALKLYHPPTWVSGKLLKYHPPGWCKGNVLKYKPPSWQSGKLMDYHPYNFVPGKIEDFHPPGWLPGKITKYKPADWVSGKLKKYHPEEWVWGKFASYHPPDWEKGTLKDHHPCDVDTEHPFTDPTLEIKEIFGKDHDVHQQALQALGPLDMEELLGLAEESLEPVNNAR